ncbi:hypothetical protein QOT17_011141 [Balamuthia mandrillaris]
MQSIDTKNQVPLHSMKEEVGLKQDHPPLGGNIEKLASRRAETLVKNNKTPTATSRNIAALLGGRDRAIEVVCPALSGFCKGARRKKPPE